MNRASTGGLTGIPRLTASGRCEQAFRSAFVQTTLARFTSVAPVTKVLNLTHTSVPTDGLPNLARRDPGQTSGPELYASARFATTVIRFDGKV